MNAGILVDSIKAAVMEHGATALTELRIRIGNDGPLYKIHAVKGQQDARGFRLLLQANALPDLTDG
jgi:hypothetical protein